MPRLPMQHNRRATLTALSALAAGALAPWHTSSAQSHGPIRLLVGYSAGGPVDLAARMLAASLGEVLGATVVVENKPGAGGSLAGNEVARARPDGTLLWFAASPTMVSTPHVLKKMLFDPLADLTPIAPVLNYYNVLVVNKDRPYTTVAELLDWARAHPGRFSYGSAGMGASNHLGGELFAMRCGVQLTHIPYKGNAPAMADVIGGQIDGMFDSVGTAKPQIDAGKVRAIAVASLQRYPRLPDVPTLDESGIEGLKDFDLGIWCAVFGPKGMPTELVQRLNADINQVLGKSAAQERLRSMGHAPWSGTPQDVQERTVREHALWASVVRGIKFE